MFYFTPENGFQTIELHGANIPPDAVPVTPKQHRDLMIAHQRGCGFAVQNGQVVAVEVPRPSREIIRKTFSRYTTMMIDNMARTFHYDNARDILSFVDDPNPTYDKQARDFRAWRSAVWTEFDRRFNYEHPDTIDAVVIQEWVATLPPWPEQEDEVDEAAKAARQQATQVEATFLTGQQATHAQPDFKQEDLITEPVESGTQVAPATPDPAMDRTVTINNEPESKE